MNCIALGMAVAAGFLANHPADALVREFRRVAAELAKTERIDAESMRTFFANSPEFRRGLLQLEDPDQPLKGNRYVEVAAFALARDPDDNVRTHAACALVHRGLGSAIAEQAVAEALADPSRDVRLFACQALGLGNRKGQAPAIRKLLGDPEEDVRMMAVTTLGRLRDTDSLDAVLKQHEIEKVSEETAYQFGIALARLGEKKVSRMLIRASIASDNWNIRYFVADALADVITVDAVPTAMECFALELKRIIRGDKHTGFDERIYQKLIAILAKRTGKDFGDDPTAWAKWWDTARVPYAAPALELDVEAVKQAYAEHLKSKAAK